MLSAVLEDNNDAIQFYKNRGWRHVQEDVVFGKEFYEHSIWDTHSLGPFLPTANVKTNLDLLLRILSAPKTGWSSNNNPPRR